MPVLADSVRKPERLPVGFPPVRESTLITRSSAPASVKPLLPVSSRKSLLSFTESFPDGDTDGIPETIHPTEIWTDIHGRGRQGVRTQSPHIRPCIRRTREKHPFFTRSTRWGCEPDKNGLDQDSIWPVGTHKYLLTESDCQAEYLCRSVQVLNRLNKHCSDV